MFYVSQMTDVDALGVNGPSVNSQCL